MTNRLGLRREFGNKLVIKMVQSTIYLIRRQRGITARSASRLPSLTEDRYFAFVECKWSYAGEFQGINVVTDYSLFHSTNSVAFSIMKLFW